MRQIGSFFDMVVDQVLNYVINTKITTFEKTQIIVIWTERDRIEFPIAFLTLY